MSLILTVGLFVLALVLVVVSSNYFVEFATRIAKRFGVSEFIIGLTLVAVGTSLPELINTIVSSMHGVNDFAYGNIVGSNMANLGLSIGMCILLVSLSIQPRLYRRELVVLAVSTLVFAVAAWDGLISGEEAIVLLGLYIIYLNSVTKIFFDFRRLIDPAELSYFVTYFSKSSALATVSEVSSKLRRFWSRKNLLSILGLIVSGGVLLFASDLLVSQALKLASLLGVGGPAIGATIVAIGTTTPELSVSISSVRKGYYRLFFGNIIGSNITNILLIIGIGAAINPISLSRGLVFATLPFLIVGTALLALLLSWQKIVSKFYGILLLALYLGFLLLVWNLA